MGLTSSSLAVSDCTSADSSLLGLLSRVIRVGEKVDEGELCGALTRRRS